MKLLLIKELSAEKKIPISKMAEQVGLSEQNIHRSIRNNKIDAEVLGKIAYVLGVSVTIFYEDMSVGPDSNTNKSDSARIKYLEELLENKGREIELLKETIRDKNDIIALLKERDAQTGDTATCAVAGGA